MSKQTFNLSRVNFFRVVMAAYGNNGIRTVTVPREELESAGDNLNAILGRVYYYGQNDFQPRNFPSVSCGDVIILDDVDGRHHFFLVVGIGFRRLELEEYLDWIQAPAIDAEGRSTKSWDATFKMESNLL